MDVLQMLVKILSEDTILIQNRLKFVHSLEISGAKMAPWLSLFAMGQCQPYDLIHKILSEWIATREDSATIKELRRILQLINLNACSNKLSELEKMYPGPMKTPDLPRMEEPDPFVTQNLPRMEPASIEFGVTDVVVNFTGREEELAKLNEYYQSRNCRSVLLSGLGGIGKTELAKKFTQDISDPSGSIKTVKSWLSGESSQTLLNSTTQFCHQLRLSATGSDGQPLEIQDMLKNIHTRLQSTKEYSRWLVVIDFVDEIHQEFQTALKTLSGFGSFVFLLVTSRRRDIPTGELLQVPKFKLQDSIKFIKSSLKTNKSSEAAVVALCGKNQLDNFPLALSQAVAYIKQQQRETLTGVVYSVQNYLDDLTKKETLGLDSDSQFAEYPKAALKVWQLTLDEIEKSHGNVGKKALNLLNMMAFIIPDNVHTPILQKLYKRFYTINEEIALGEIHSYLTILLQYSMISSCNTVISIHRLVQLSLRQQMASGSSQILKSFWTSFSPKEWNRDEMPNILKIWKESSTHTDLNEQVAIKNYLLSQRIHNLGMINESYDFATDCCNSLRDLYGPDSKSYFVMEQRLAIAMRGKGQFEAAFKKLTFVHRQLKKPRIGGKDDAYTLHTGQWIAIVLTDLKRYSESIEWGEKILKSKIRIYGAKNEFTMQTKHDLASTLQNSGKAEKAAKMYNEVLEWRKERLGDQHPSTLATRHNIGVCFYSVGKYEEARDIFQNVLKLRGPLGVDHPENLKTKEWLAATFYKMGDIPEALKNMEEVADTREGVLGAEHPQTVAARREAEFLKDKQNQINKKDKKKKWWFF